MTTLDLAGIEKPLLRAQGLLFTNMMVNIFANIFVGILIPYLIWTNLK